MAFELVNWITILGCYSNNESDSHLIVFPEPETPLQWLSEHLSYPDNFLHICLLTQDDASEDKENESGMVSELPAEETATEC